MDINEDILQWFMNFLIKKSKSSGVAMLQKEQLAEELHKPIIKKFKKRKSLFFI